jgi:Zn-dependent protease with chaperone function
MRVAILKLLIFVFVAGCRAPDAGVLPVGEGRGREVLEERHERERGKARLERVGGRLAGVVPRPGGVAGWEFRVERGWTPNAHADGSGVVTLTTGLLAFAGEDDLLAFALAHEMAHVVGGDVRGQRGEDVLRLVVGAVGAVAVGGVSGDGWLGLGAGVVSVAGGDLAVWRVRQRGREMRADARAQEWCVAAGYRGDCGERFWRAYAAARPVPERAAWRSKHPGDLERAEALGVVGR